MSTQSAACSSMAISLTGYLVYELANMDAESTAEINTTVHKILSGLGFAGLALLGIIETVVRGILSILAFAVMCCLPESLKERVQETLPYGTAISAVAIYASFESIYKLISE